MILFIECPQWIRALYLLTFSTMGFISLYAFIESLAQKQKWRCIILYFMIFFFNFYLTQLLSLVADQNNPPEVYWLEMHFEKISFPIALLILIFASILTIVSTVRLLKSRRLKITHMSIQKGLDHIDTGLCFHRQNGFVLLINYKMSELCFQMTSSALMDANAFWDDLVHKRLSEGNESVEGRENPVIRLKNGEIWSFNQIKIDAQKEEIYQIIAVNITELEALHKALSEENQKLKNMNMRLKNFKHFVDQVVHLEEVLAARAKIHDDFGKILLATKLYITQEHPNVSGEYILNMWKKNISLMYEDIVVESNLNPMKEIVDAASFIGAAIKVNGEVPTEKHTLKLFLTAARECLTNAVHHANADELNIEVTKDENNYHILYTNNGETPKQPIKEGSGLSSLRNIVENNGAIMKIEISPQFSLKLIIPIKKGRYDYD